MITIENLNKIEQKPLGKKNFYVARVTQVNGIINPYTFEREHRYIFELSNRKYAINVILNRNGDMRQYKLQSSNGNVLYITKRDIRNLDIFLDKLRYVALG